MNVGGITDRLMLLRAPWFGTAGRACQIDVVLSIFFAGISGSSTADAASQSKIFIEAQRKEGYDDSFSVAISRLGRPRGHHPAVDPDGRLGRHP